MKPTLSEFIDSAKESLLAIIEQSKRLKKTFNTERTFVAELKTKANFKKFMKDYAGKKNLETRINPLSYIVRDALFDPTYDLNAKLIDLESFLRMSYKETYPEDTKAEREREKRSKAFEKDVRGTQKAETQAKKDYVAIFTTMNSVLQTDFTQSNGNSRVFTSKLKAYGQSSNNAIGKFIETYFAGSDNAESRINTFIYAIRDNYFPSTSPDAPKNPRAMFDKKLAGIVKSSHKNRVLNEEREALESVIPESFLQYLPSTLIVEVDKNSKITKIRSKFAERINDIGAKIERQKDLLKNLTKLELKIKKDLKSTDHDTKMKALIIYLMLDTGIRPGAEQNKIRNPDFEVDALTDEDDEDEYDEFLETYGATTLNKQHILFVRENFISLKFRGKKGTINLADISDATLVKAIKDLVEKTRNVERSNYLFLDSAGQIFDQPKITAYLRAIIPGLNLTDFRKLKSSRVLLDALREKQEILLQKIYDLNQQQVEDLKEQVISLIEEVVEESFEQSMVALSHQNMNTTIKSYINPQVLLNFLSTGKVADKLEDIVLNQQNLKFDPQVFITSAIAYGSAIGELTQGASTTRTASLRELFRMIA
jgi:DNA topoisomerase IB